MKISKLFHWLYAFLMFLPVTFLLPSLLYFGFNDNATAQEYTKEETFVYETNEVNSVDDLIVGHVYTITRVENQAFNFGYSFFNRISGDRYGPYTNSANKTGLFTSVGVSHLSVVTSPTSIYTYLNYEVDFVLTDIIDATDIGGVSSCTRTYTYNKDVTYTMGITESINQSILDTFDLPMFSWTSDNFIIAPFNYITNLFGLPRGNVVNKYLDYWLSISIIYLCFDVIMYVPLLVHRWLDKGIVE